MKLNRDHLIAEQLAVQDRIRDSSALSLNPFNYGILPPLPQNRFGLDVRLTSDRFNTLSIRVSECRGITPGGQRIEISESNNIKLAETSCFLSAEINLNQTTGREYMIVISANPLERVPVGEHNPIENPPRNPFASESYFLNVLPVDDVAFSNNGFYHLTIGKLRIEGSSGILDENYIPPVVSVQSHPDLVELWQLAESKLSEMERNLVEIIQKIYLKKQTDDLPQTALEVAKAGRDFFSHAMFAYRQMFFFQSPVYFFGFFSDLARCLKNALDSREGSGKEQFLGYIRAWVIEISQAEFESLLEDMVNNRYDHMNIHRSVIPVQKFAKSVFSVFAKLADLDFIGDKKMKGPIDLPGMQASAQVSQQPIRKGPML